MFTNLLTWVHGQIESLQAQLGEKLRKIDEEGEKALADAAAKRRDEGAADENVGGDERAETRRQDEGRAARKKLEEEAVKPSIEELKEAAALVWIKYMHFVRRTEVSRSADSVLTFVLTCCVPLGSAALSCDLWSRSQEPALHVAGVRGQCAHGVPLLEGGRRRDARLRGGAQGVRQRRGLRRALPRLPHQHQRRQQ
jgi:hypothetical protein